MSYPISYSPLSHSNYFYLPMGEYVPEVAAVSKEKQDPETNEVSTEETTTLDEAFPEGGLQAWLTVAGV